MSDHMMSISGVQFWAGIIIFLFSFAGGVWKIASIFNEAMKRMDESIATTKGEFNARLEIFDRDQSDKVKRVYERFDDHKRICDDKFISKEMCGVMHRGTEGAVRELKDEIKTLHGKIDRLMEVRADA